MTKVKSVFKLFRDREDHLTIFLHHLHPILQRQQLNYQIFVIEQSKEELFNQGTLMNIGFVEALKVSEDFDCFVFHDVDLLSEDDR
jgi:beta-1,4-galactosyltransferase 1